MNDLMNALKVIQARVAGSGVKFRLKGDSLYVEGRARPWAVVRLHRPSATEVAARASPDTMLVLLQASAKAVEAANPFNHIVLPDGSFRIVAPGVALLREAPPPESRTTQARLQGRSGVVVETLLLGANRAWSVREVAGAAGVSPGLAHRVLDRLEKEGCLEANGAGPRKTRTLVKPTVLAQVWSQEEVAPKVVLRGYLYGSSPDSIALKALRICPEGAVAGVAAANNYAPILTRVPFPIRLWVPEDFWAGRLAEAGVEETSEGSNIEFVQAKGDPWRRHRNAASVPQVSAWRAWQEVSIASGRVGELAEQLLKQLQSRFEQGTPVGGESRWR